MMVFIFFIMNGTRFCCRSRQTHFTLDKAQYCALLITSICYIPVICGISFLLFFASAALGYAHYDNC
jgi:hypothetical protein